MGAETTTWEARKGDLRCKHIAGMAGVTEKVGVRCYMLYDLNSIVMRYNNIIYVCIVICQKRSLLIFTYNIIQIPNNIIHIQIWSL